MTPPVPAALLAAFGDRLTISAPELCRLLPIDADTLRGHIKRGHIAYVQIGFGERAPRRAFTLEAVLAFLQGRERVQNPVAKVRHHQRVAPSPVNAEHNVRAIRARLLAERPRARELVRRS